MYRRFLSVVLSISCSCLAIAEPPGYYFLDFDPFVKLTWADPESAQIVTDAFTVEALFRLDASVNDYANIFCLQGATGLDYSLPNDFRTWIPNDPGGWSFFLKTDQGIVGTPPIDLPVDTWMHIAETYDGAMLRFFIDGSEVASVPHTGQLTQETDLDLVGTNIRCLDWPMVPLIGLGTSSAGPENHGFEGTLGDVAVWDRALPVLDLAARSSHYLTGLEPGLIHYWPLDDGTEPARNLVPNAPPMHLGWFPLAEGPLGPEPEWLVTDPFYVVHEDWIDDLPPVEDGSMSWDSWAVADFNQDGWDDILFNGMRGDLCDPAEQPFMILVGDGTGQYVDGTSQVIDGPVPAPKHAFRGVVEDFNGDDLPDFFSGNIGEDFCDDVGWTNTLMLTNQDGKLYDASENILGAPCTSTVPLYQGQAPCYLGGDFGGRTPGIRYPDTNALLTALDPDYTHSTAAGDIDNDGDIDIYAGNYPAHENEAPYFLLNDGSGLFEADWDSLPPIVFEIYLADGIRAPITFANSLIADVDRDDSEDLLLCCLTPDHNAPPNTPGGTLRGGVFWGDGSGDFSTADYTPFPRPGQEWWDSAGGLLPIDIDGDEDMDLVVGYGPSAFGSPAQQPDATPMFIQVLVNRGNRQFVDESATRILTPSSNLMWIQDIYEVDFNLDDCPDFVVMHQAWYWGENIYLNDCNGRFSAINPAIVGKMRMILPLDVHGDGDLDFVSFGLPAYGPDPLGDFAILEKVRPFITTLFRDGFESGDTSTWSASMP